MRLTSVATLERNLFTDNKDLLGKDVVRNAMFFVITVIPIAICVSNEIPSVRRV